MAFHDEILRDIRAGRVPLRFKTGDLKKVPAGDSDRYRVGNRNYSTNTINTVPRNHSIRPDGTDPGDYVQKGRAPAFWWHGKGEYELILDQQHCLHDVDPDDEDLLAAEGDGEALLLAEPNSNSSAPILDCVDEILVRKIVTEVGPDPAAIIVRYLAENPFQCHYRRQSVGPLKKGWGERLAMYYWPKPELNWQVTCQRVTDFSSRIQQAVRKIKESPEDKAAGEQLLTAFKDVCAWGGVKLPESDCGSLATEVMRALLALSRGETPPGDCRLNSAWTKLYAFAHPEDCVIYDSRVAAALTSILDPVMNIVSAGPAWRSYAALGTIPGRGGSRPRALRWAWPNGYQSWSAQTAASLLCRDVRDKINLEAESQTDCQKRNDPSPWSLREMEAVLFMEGY